MESVTTQLSLFQQLKLVQSSEERNTQLKQQLLQQLHATLEQAKEQLDSKINSIRLKILWHSTYYLVCLCKSKTIQEVIDNLREQTKYSFEIILFYKGIALRSDQSIETYGVKSGSLLTMFTKSIPIQLQCFPQIQHTFHLELGIYPHLTVYHLKQQLQSLVHIPLDWILLKEQNGRMLNEEEEELVSCITKENQCMQVASKFSTIQLYYYTTQLQRLIIQTFIDTKIEQIKLEIANELQCKEQNLKLFYREKLLHNQSTIFEEEFVEGDVIEWKINLE